LSINKSYVATIGFFDGVHQGHRYLIRQVMDEAEGRGMKPMVVTFPTHPRKVLHSDYQPNLITTCEEKVELLKATGVENVALMEFTHDLSMMSAKEYMQMLHDDYGVCVLVIGYDHKFGHNRSEGFDDYVRYGKEMGMDVVRAKEEPDGKYSSTAARNALLEGDVKTASHVLGYPYFIQGNVVKGFHVGTKIGYPTANIDVDNDKLIPKNGVYAVRVQEFMGGASSFRMGMLNIGYRPTLDNGPQMTIEVHILDYDEDLYGKALRLEFIERLRDEEKFDSIDELKAQLARDEQECRTILNNI